MTTITRYICDFDGEEFENKDECIRHEYEISHLPQSIIWWGENKKALIPTTPDEIESMYNEMVECDVYATRTWKEDLKFMVEYFGFLDDITEPGTYVWHKNCLGWGDRLIKKEGAID